MRKRKGWDCREEEKKEAPELEMTEVQMPDEDHDKNNIK